MAPPVHDVKALRRPDGSEETGSTCQVMIEDALELDRVLLDSGADVNDASSSRGTRLESNGVSCWAAAIMTPAWLVGNDTDPLTMVLSRLVMERLGYSADDILAKAYGTKPEWDLKNLATEEGPFKTTVMVNRGLMRPCGRRRPKQGP
ncbi:hypothetical protein PHYPSEUDO_014423 [Phytophthora pseudosyringae]|uniref:Uncharacterized protein n=1 Tax=Phytophthora pseudosyringae TaxID=221518 RepID=A0A8T1W661_9STRA|nr:hypothetical protein PHYPSEUDO_014423 [Phytophthora pseudosyringae]